ncbi:MAG: DNA/RNA nuclease SfsA [Candidatus Thermoplasmatota archaeon]|jgi:sugar fermentation stimulation protein A|nr:DNA/RNA nuclease SfsA [Candidatus Thermoplasmatota archaeon]
MTLFIYPEIGEEVLRIREPLIHAIVVSRPNRFLVIAEINGKEITVHLHDPGRLRELIYPGAEVLLRKTHGDRTDYSITAAEKGGETILLDTRFHNEIGKRFISEPTGSEVKYGDSRFDFSVNGGFVEIKGCTMQIGDYVIFPDAPSVRGTKHLTELSSLKRNGRASGVIFLIFRWRASYFYPNRVTDQKFAAAFFQAYTTGVEMTFPKFQMEQNSIIFQGMLTLGPDPTNIFLDMKKH